MEGRGRQGRGVWHSADSFAVAVMMPVEGGGASLMNVGRLLWEVFRLRGVYGSISPPSSKGIHIDTDPPTPCRHHLSLPLSTTTAASSIAWDLEVGLQSAYCDDSLPCSPSSPPSAAHRSVSMATHHSVSMATHRLTD